MRITLILLALSSLFTLRLNGQLKFDTELLKDPKKNGVAIAAKLKTIEVDEYKDTLQHRIYLKNGFRSSNFLNEKEYLALIDTVIPYRVDVVYSKYPLRNGKYEEIYPLLLNRIKTVLELDEGLNDEEIEWNKVLQTHCVNDEQVNSLFHGVVIWYHVQEKEPEVKPEQPPLTKTELIEVEQNKLVSEQNSLEDLTESIENIKSYSYFPDSLKKKIENKSLDVQIKTIKTFLEKEIAKTPETNLKESTEEERAGYDKEITSFLKKYPVHDNVVTEVLNRHPEWKNALVINDWTGSMYAYGAQVLEWHLRNFKKSGIMSLTLFNDGDEKRTEQKRVGETGGVYHEKADNLAKLVKLFNYIMLKGSGGDGPENDVEGILKAMEEYENYSEIILIADNNACVRDIELATRIGKPVKVIVCGYSKAQGVHPDLVYIAKVTGGGIYTIEDDLENIKVEIGDKGKIISSTDPRFKTYERACGEYGYSGGSSELHTDYKYAHRHKNKMRRLALEKKELAEVPKGIYKMKKLSYLSLRDNSLSEISYKIENLEYLKDLDLAYNKFSSLPSQLRNVHYIETIDLSHNSFSSVPGPVLAMKYLLKLDLSHNNIAALDKNMNMRKLEDLDLSHNMIMDLPRIFTQLRKLKKLDLSYNMLTSLPENFPSLIKLEKLNLSNNSISKLPEQLFKLRNLKVLNLEGNKINEIEKERIRKMLPSTKISF